MICSEGVARATLEGALIPEVDVFDWLGSSPSRVDVLRRSEVATRKKGPSRWRLLVPPFLRLTVKV